MHVPTCARASKRYACVVRCRIPSSVWPASKRCLQKARTVRHGHKELRKSVLASSCSFRDFATLHSAGKWCRPQPHNGVAAKGCSCQAASMGSGRAELAAAAVASLLGRTQRKTTVPKVCAAWAQVCRFFLGTSAVWAGQPSVYIYVYAVS